MQKFTYHCHTNSLDLFDGANSIAEMIAQAQNLGFEEIGISNHLVCNPRIGTIDKFGKMFLRDYQTALEAYKQTVKLIRDEAAKAKIKVYAGFEVDYFYQDQDWLEFFEKVKKEVKADYYIAASHLVKIDDSYNSFTYLDKADLPSSKKETCIRWHLRTLAEAVKTKDFSFVAHFNQAAKKPVSEGMDFSPEINSIAEALIESGTAFELTTKGLRKYGEFMPSNDLVKKLCQAGVPVVISDDAHRITEMGVDFHLAEEFLSSIGCINRFSLK